MADKKIDPVVNLDNSSNNQNLSQFYDYNMNSDGIIIEENNAFKSRAENRFKNSKCKACRIFPICGGGCSQKPIHFNGKDYCIFKDDEDLKNDVILDRFIFNIRSNPKWSAK